MSHSPSPRNSSHGLSNLHLRDNISEPDSQSWTPALSQTRAPTPASASAPAPTPGQDLQSVDIDHETTKAILDVVQRLYGNYFYPSWNVIPYETQLTMFNEFKG
ncbi:hypothetical protein K7X08_000121 [Anisodus acutangulus]|uniref:Uncharacterized protein n=1 Tax=Anisodus acutangulus TaxID=402998 RepID=A0A9Q1RD78_9SOLA|nr:hypothetical protein K7X08_000121 [Anisodus acutangulus]